MIRLKAVYVAGAGHAEVMKLTTGRAMRLRRSRRRAADPTRKQYNALRKGADISAPETFHLKSGQISITLLPKALDLVEIH